MPNDHRASEFAEAGDAGQGLDIERLERAVQALAERHAALRDQNTKLARDVAERDQRIAELEGEVRRQNQTRRDVARRIDDLVGQIDELEGRLVARAE
ncbi:MAG: cell division protein ZapB [Thermoanaerobaculia bacterium]